MLRQPMKSSCCFWGKLRFWLVGDGRGSGVLTLIYIITSRYLTVRHQ